MHFIVQKTHSNNTYRHDTKHDILTKRLLELCPRAWCLKLLHQLASNTASWLHRVDAALDWLPVEGGESLYRKGDTMVGFFVVLSGRLVALEAHQPSAQDRMSGSAGHGVQWRVTDTLNRTRLCGEIDCLRDRPYSQTVQASRDSEVCRVSPKVLRKHNSTRKRE